jgi:hypothetical protein
MKAYVRGYKFRESANHEIVDYWFCLNPKDALVRPTREWAEGEVSLFSRGITINEDLKRPYVLTEFEIEPLADGFVISCDGPFEVRGVGDPRLIRCASIGIPTVNRYAACLRA